MTIGEIGQNLYIREPVFDLLQSRIPKKEIEEGGIVLRQCRSQVDSALSAMRVHYAVKSALQTQVSALYTAKPAKRDKHSR